MQQSNRDNCWDPNTTHFLLCLCEAHHPGHAPMTEPYCTWSGEHLQLRKYTTSFGWRACLDKDEGFHRLFGACFFFLFFLFFKGKRKQWEIFLRGFTFFGYSMFGVKTVSCFHVWIGYTHTHKHTHAHIYANDSHRLPKTNAVHTLAR